jgi:multisubunit Na+/H+ antiporter MnhB subunit
MIVAAMIAINEKSLFSTDIAFGFVGVALCVVFFALRAPEVAIAQLIVELLVFIIMIRVSGVRRDVPEAKERWMRFVLGGSAALGAAIVGYFASLALGGLHPFGSPVMTVSQRYIDLCRVPGSPRNSVSAILLDFRLLDSLGQVALLFSAVISVLVVLRKKGRKKVEERHDSDH